MVSKFDVGAHLWKRIVLADNGCSAIFFSPIPHISGLLSIGSSGAEYIYSYYFSWHTNEHLFFCGFPGPEHVYICVELLVRRKSLA